VAGRIIPMSELRHGLERVLAALEATGEPYYITEDSRPTAVLARYDDYSALAQRAEDGSSHLTREPGISGGEPIIRGTRISVRHIVERVQAGQSVDEILAALPHLTAAQVHAALAYYCDHQAEIDQPIEASRPEQVLASHGISVKRLGQGVANVESSES